LYSFIASHALFVDWFATLNHEAGSNVVEGSAAVLRCAGPVPYQQRRPRF